MTSSVPLISSTVSRRYFFNLERHLLRKFVRESLESDRLSQMEVEGKLVSAGASIPGQKGGTLHPLGGVVLPEISRYLAVLLLGWLSVRGLEIGCGGGTAAVAPAAQPNPLLYVAAEEENAPVSAFISGSDLSFGGHAVKSARTAFAPVHFPAVPLSSLPLAQLQDISVMEILAPTVPLPPNPSRGALPAAPTGVSVQFN
jgi:hypothetical protein